MKTNIAIFLAALLLAGCAFGPETRPLAAVDGMPETTADGTSTAGTLHGYKVDLAQRISQVNSTKVYVGRPQPLLRSVIVVKFYVDANGQLLRSDILRTNHDHVTEATALATLRNTAPFPKPAAHLLRQGRVEILESWLFNNDGRFQLRSIAMPQMDE